MSISSKFPIQSPALLATLALPGLFVALPALAQDLGANALLPHDLSLSGMFLAASTMVKGVIIGLGLASVLTWTVWAAKTVELVSAKRRLLPRLAVMRDARSLADTPEGANGVLADLYEAARLELRLSADAMEKDGIKERVSSRLERIEAAAGRAMSRGTGVLATIGATAPFVGLFGTVWGIMNAFIDISKAQTTNLAVVAPGIAEALLTTAIGLATAIPAVVIYNIFARSIAGYRALVADASAEVLRLVSRDLDRKGAGPVRLSAAE